jgi:DNA-binding YbaB/EbfC family protein
LESSFFFSKPPAKKEALVLVNNMGALIEKMQQLQEELKDKTIEISEGGGSCRILINGHQEVRAVHIERALLAAGQAEQLEALLVKTINKAIAESRNIIKNEIGKMTGGIDFSSISGMF